MSYTVRVRRGRTQLCMECRESILLTIAHDIIGLGGGEVDDAHTRSVVDAVAAWTALATETHDHREWLIFCVDRALEAVDAARIESGRCEGELRDLVRRVVRADYAAEATTGDPSPERSATRPAEAPGEPPRGAP